MRGVIAGAAVLFLAGCQFVPRPAPVQQASAESVQAPPQLMADLTALSSDAMEGRGAGTAGGYRAADYVERRFRQLGLVGAFDGGFRQDIPLRQGGRGVNVVGMIPGTAFPQQVLMVTAHFDHLGVRLEQVYNGADDNASGVAAMLAVAEHLKASPPQHTVIFAGLDGEEQGLVGAQALAETPPVPLGAILAVVNLDMVSRGPLWMAGGAHYPHLRQLLEAPLTERGLGVQFGHDTGGGSDNWTGASDHAAFHQRGVPFVYLGVEDHADYHKPTDDAERIDPAMFARASSTIQATIEILDASHAALVEGR